MRSKFKNLLFLVSILLLFVNHEMYAQLRNKSTIEAKTKKNNKEQFEFLNKIGGDIFLGNVGFFNGLSISSKLSAGYKLGERFALGGGLKLFYDQYSVIGPDPSVFDIGGLFMGKAKITRDIYVKAEYTFMNYAKDPDGYNIRYLNEDLKVNYPLFGIGYFSGTDKWKFGIELLYIADETARDLQRAVVEYWFGASYNF